jgi:hypothetical protein
MFRCQICGTVVPAGTPCHRLVAETRPTRYPFRNQVNRVVRLVNGKRKIQYTDDPGGEGQCILREVNACPACASRAAVNGRADGKPFPERPASGE